MIFDCWNWKYGWKESRTSRVDVSLKTLMFPRNIEYDKNFNNSNILDFELNSVNGNYLIFSFWSVFNTNCQCSEIISISNVHCSHLWFCYDSSLMIFYTVSHENHSSLFKIIHFNFWQNEMKFQLMDVSYW